MKLEYFFVLVFTLISPQLNAGSTSDKNAFYESNLEAHSFCAATYYVRTADVPGQESHSALYQNYGEMSQFLGSLYYKQLTGKTATRGITGKFREKYLLDLETKFRKNRTLSESDFKKIAQCDSLILYFNNQNPQIYTSIEEASKNKMKMEQLLLKDISVTNRKPIVINKEQISRSFKVWVDDYNATTPEKMKQQLKNKIKKMQGKK